MPRLLPPKKGRNPITIFFNGQPISAKFCKCTIKLFSLSHVFDKTINDDVFINLKIPRV
jgi:hypothetical protein